MQVHTRKYFNPLFHNKCPTYSNSLSRIIVLESESCVIYLVSVVMSSDLQQDFDPIQSTCCESQLSDYVKKFTWWANNKLRHISS